MMWWRWYTTTLPLLRPLTTWPARVDIPVTHRTPAKALVLTTLIRDTAVPVTVGTFGNIIIIMLNKINILVQRSDTYCVERCNIRILVYYYYTTYTSVRVLKLCIRLYYIVLVQRYHLLVIWMSAFKKYFRCRMKCIKLNVPNTYIAIYRLRSRISWFIFFRSIRIVFKLFRYYIMRLNRIYVEFYRSPPSAVCHRTICFSYPILYYH